MAEIGGRLPTATQLHQSFIKILTKHLASNKKVNFVFQQKSSTIPMMNPSPSEIVDLFSFVEVTLIQYATVARHFPGVTASSVKPKPKKVNKAEVAPEESIKTETQANATTPTTPRPKAKGQAKGASQISPAKVESKSPDARKGGQGGDKGRNVHDVSGVCQGHAGRVGGVSGVCRACRGMCWACVRGVSGAYRDKCLLSRILCSQKHFV